MRYTGHLDLFRTLERTIRRAGLPLAYSQGYRPHPRINLACALPLGFTSECEIVDIWLDSDLPLESIQDALVSASPPGIMIKRIEQVANDLPALQASLVAADYLITFLDSMPHIFQEIEQLLGATSVPRIRHGKMYDLRPLIQEMTPLPENSHSMQRIRVILTAREGAMGRPDEVILALGHNPEDAQVHRIQLIFK